MKRSQRSKMDSTSLYPPSLKWYCTIPTQVVQVICEPGVTSKYLMNRLPLLMPRRMWGIKWRKSPFTACSNELGNAPPGMRCSVTLYENPRNWDSNSW